MLTHGEATREIPLPFIRRGNIGKREIVECYWDAKPTGDFATDYILGHRYALNFMEHEHRVLAVNPPQRIPLIYIIADMVKQGIDIQNDQIASGFLYTINNVSMDLWTPAAIAHARAGYEREGAFLVEHCRRRDAKRSARARKAALAGAAKRRESRRPAA